ncbi:MAG: hypothetical protein ACLTBR_13295 [Anaerostipes sp.]|uniref:hypothetical protein n=1 Tax=Anaerostipes sp. TaxID=1872530 RepID=UPI0039955E29
MQEIVESDLVFNISVYTSDDNLIFYSLPEQHSQPDVEVILEKMADVKRQQKTQKIIRNGRNKIRTMKQILIDVAIKE